MRGVTFRGQLLGSKPADAEWSPNGITLHWNKPLPGTVKAVSIQQVQASDVPRFPQLVQDIVNAGHRVGILYRLRVDLSKVDAQPPLVCLLLYHQDGELYGLFNGSLNPIRRSSSTFAFISPCIFGFLG